VAVLACGLAVPFNGQTQATHQAPASSAQTQRSFDTPQKAAEALIQAAGNYDVPALLEIFGPDGKDFVSSADAVQDKKYASAFAEKARTKNVVTADPKNKARATLMVGDDDWPFPVPIVQQKGKWHFDDKEGHKEILYRRIGANELDAIQVCRGIRRGTGRICIYGSRQFRRQPVRANNLQHTREA
jgi:hypothetical protein